MYLQAIFDYITPTVFMKNMTLSLNFHVFENYKLF